MLRIKYELPASYLVAARGTGRIPRCVLAIILVLSPFLMIIPFQQVFADGLFREEFEASLKGREARLSVAINPPVLTTETRQDAFVQLRLFDGITNETIKFSTFVIEMEKGIGGEGPPLYREVFHTESGLLTLKFEPQEGPVTVFANRDPLLDAWIADPSGAINIRGPVLLEGGLYHFGIEIIGIDSAVELFPPGESVSFDSWLSVGDVFHESVEYNDGSYNTTIISYYDRVHEFDFDPSKKTFAWSMPFDWNVDRIGQTSIFVHEEVKIPKAMEGIGDSLSFVASVNGDPISGSKILVDPYTSESELILHYLLSKPDILSLAEKVPDSESRMTFTLTPSANATSGTTTEMATDTGGIGVALQWTPNPLDANAESIVKVDFSDGFSGERLDDVDVLYSLRILSLEGSEVFNLAEQTANGGTDTQVIDFPTNDEYRIEVRVAGLLRDGQAADMTRNGVARGIVVVPEFPTGAMLAIAGIVGAMLVMQKFGKRNSAAGLK
jgi:hypothetical protein